MRLPCEPCQHATTSEAATLALPSWPWRAPSTAPGRSASPAAGIIAASLLVVPEAAVVERALRLYGTRGRLDFADAYLAALALEVGPPVVASLNADLGSVEGVTRIAS
jgi:hypothetical protein